MISFSNHFFICAIVLDGVSVSPQRVDEWHEHFKRWSRTHKIFIGLCAEEDLGSFILFRLAVRVESPIFVRGHSPRENGKHKKCHYY